jgi:cation transport regulator ChaC
MMVHVPVSVGELVDKITILKIKLAHARTPTQTRNVSCELDQLREILDQLELSVDITTQTAQLHAVNQELWAIEDAKRQHEKDQRFDNAFIELARAVYVKNDQRAAIKRLINQLTHSSIVEEKIY